MYKTYLYGLDSHTQIWASYTKADVFKNYVWIRADSKYSISLNQLSIFLPLEIFYVIVFYTI